MKTEVELKNLVREKYASIAKNPSQGGCCEGENCGGVEYSFIGEEYKEKEGYVAEADLGLGCGLPTEFAKIKPGDTVVDLGSGAGNDCFIARAEAGPEGKIIGVDFTSEMIAKARENATKMGFSNVTLYEGEIDNNPLDDNIDDVVVSNCVFNLIPNRKKAFEETMFRRIGLILLCIFLQVNGEISVKHVFDITGNFTFNQRMADECLNSSHIEVQPPFHQPGMVTVRCHMSWKPNPYFASGFRILLSHRKTFSLGCVSGELEFHSSKSDPVVSLNVHDWWYCGFPRDPPCNFTKQTLKNCLDKRVGKTQISFDFIGVPM